VPGGAHNVADGTNSFAAGRRAKANFNGMFVWADNSAFDFPFPEEPREIGPNEFLVRATGGATFVTQVGSVYGLIEAGVTIDFAENSWSSLGGKNLRENIEPVDGSQLLAKIASLPISTFNYKAQDASIRHIGPAAEDLYAAFGMGKDERQISTIDADGIALAAIKELQKENVELRKVIEELEKRMVQVESRR
jgi:hypothetical protein